MSGWNSYRAVHGAELRAAAREFSDHGWPVIEETATTLLLTTGAALDVLEVPAALGQQVCAQLRDAGSVVPLAATPTGAWWFPVTAGSALPGGLAERRVVLHSNGATVAAPPSETPDGWVHWRVAPALCGYRLPPADSILHAVIDAVARQLDHDDERSGAHRLTRAVVAGTRF